MLCRAETFSEILTNLEKQKLATNKINNFYQLPIKPIFQKEQI